MFRVKICGVQLKSDLDAVSASGADAVGLNFYPRSVRFLDPESTLAASLSAHAAKIELKRVGVFVNETQDRIQRVIDTVGLDAVQLHGDESKALAQRLLLSGFHVIRAIKLPTGSLHAHQIADATSEWTEIGVHLLLDADGGARHGGSGQSLDWRGIAEWAAQQNTGNWTLAGGLNPANVAEAANVSTADSVDVASGVESVRGTKDPSLIREFTTRFLQRAR